MTETPPSIGFFEKYLTAWVLLCIAAGIALGELAGSGMQVIADLEINTVNIPVAILIWLMIYPMMVQVDFDSVRRIGPQLKGLGLTVVVNWLIKPFTMAFFAWIFFTKLYAAWITPELANEYIAGAILLGAAPCTAMVFVWSSLSRGDAPFTLSQVALNDAVMVVAFAPIVALLLGVSAILVPWDTLAISVALFIVVPVIAAQMLRAWLADPDGARLAAFGRAVEPLSIVALLATVLLLFAFQGDQILGQPAIIALLAVPILLQTVFIFGLAYALNRAAGEAHCIAGPSALIGASNFFELAVAVAISLFGIDSGAALATVVGVLIEVPVMLALVAVVDRTKPWYEAGRAVRRRMRGT
jgi:ACR3 family arsenite transporter